MAGQRQQTYYKNMMEGEDRLKAMDTEMMHIQAPAGKMDLTGIFLNDQYVAHRLSSSSEQIMNSEIVFYLEEGGSNDVASRER